MSSSFMSISWARCPQYENIHAVYCMLAPGVLPLAKGMSMRQFVVR